MKDKIVNMFHGFSTASFELQRKLLMEVMFSLISFVVMLCYLITDFSLELLLASLFIMFVLFLYCGVCFLDIANNKYVKFQGKCVDLDVTKSSVTALLEDNNNTRYKVRIISRIRRKVQLGSCIYFYAKTSSVLPIENSLNWVKNYFILNIEK